MSDLAQYPIEKLVPIDAHCVMPGIMVHHIDDDESYGLVVSVEMDGNEPLYFSYVNWSIHPKLTVEQKIKNDIRKVFSNLIGSPNDERVRAALQNGVQHVLASHMNKNAIQNFDVNMNEDGSMKVRIQNNRTMNYITLDIEIK